MSRKHSDEYVTEEIHNVMNALNIHRMPSRSEIKAVTKNDSLANLIMKRGGFFGWANKLGLELKGSCTLFGAKYENLCASFLIENGMHAELTGVKSPYDVLVNKVTKIDVKASNGYVSPEGSSWFSFNLGTKIPKCDFYVCYCLKRMEKVLIIPASILYGISQLSIGFHSEYDAYASRWDLIEKHVKLMENFLGEDDERTYS